MHGANEYDNDMDAYMKINLWLNGYSNAKLTFWYWIESEVWYQYDTLSVKISWTKNDNTYYEYYPFEIRGDYQYWQEATIDLSDICSGEYITLEFIFKSDYSVVYEGAYLDDITLTI